MKKYRLQRYVRTRTQRYTFIECIWPFTLSDTLGDVPSCNSTQPCGKFFSLFKVHNRLCRERSPLGQGLRSTHAPSRQPRRAAAATATVIATTATLLPPLALSPPSFRAGPTTIARQLISCSKHLARMNACGERNTALITICNGAPPHPTRFAQCITSNSLIAVFALYPSRCYHASIVRWKGVSETTRTGLLLYTRGGDVRV